MDNTDAPKVRLYTIAEFAGLVKASYGTIRQMVLEGAIYENEIVRLRKSVKIKHEAYDRLVSGAKTSRISRKKLPYEKECARIRHEQSHESLQQQLREKNLRKKNNKQY